MATTDDKLLKLKKLVLDKQSLNEKCSTISPSSGVIKREELMQYLENLLRFKKPCQQRPKIVRLKKLFRGKRFSVKLMQNGTRKTQHFNTESEASQWITQQKNTWIPLPKPNLKVLQPSSGLYKSNKELLKELRCHFGNAPYFQLAKQWNVLEQYEKECGFTDLKQIFEKSKRNVEVLSNAYLKEHHKSLLTKLTCVWGIKIEAMAKYFGVLEDWKEAVVLKQCASMGQQRWTVEHFHKITLELLKEQNTLPPGLWLQSNGYGSYQFYMYENNISREDMQEIYNFSAKNVSRNGMKWDSMAEQCLSDYLHCRGITLLHGTAYPEDYKNFEGGPAIKGKHDGLLPKIELVDEYKDKDLDIEVWGNGKENNSKGPTGKKVASDKYAARRKQKEAYHRGNKYFLGISYLDCYDEKKLTKILEPYIGIIEPFVFTVKRDHLVESTKLSRTDKVLKMCKWIIERYGDLPGEGWMRKRKGGKYENRKRELWEDDKQCPNLNSLCVWIKQIGGMKKVRQLLELPPNPFYWTKEEDNLILKGKKEKLTVQQIQQTFLPHRTKSQVQYRYQRFLQDPLLAVKRKYGTITKRKRTNDYAVTLTLHGTRHHRVFSTEKDAESWCKEMGNKKKQKRVK